MIDENNNDIQLPELSPAIERILGQVGKRMELAEERAYWRSIISQRQLTSVEIEEYRQFVNNFTMLQEEEFFDECD